MGHDRIAGRVSEFQVAGFAYVRVDVPETSKLKAFTRLLNPSAVYSMTPVDEQIARSAAERIEATPVTTYYVSDLLDDVKREVSARYESRLKQIERPRSEFDDDSDDDYYYSKTA